MNYIVCESLERPSFADISMNEMNTSHFCSLALTNNELSLVQYHVLVNKCNIMDVSINKKGWSLVDLS